MIGLQGTVHILVTAGVAFTVYQHFTLKGQFQQYIDNSHLIETDGSSVWCWGNNHTDRMCRFKNVCYQRQWQEFVFFHGPNSACHGLPSDRFSPTLLELSSVKNHNRNYFNFVDASAIKAKSMLSKIRMVEGTSLVFNRFHPENLMHVFHDDLLPIYHTLKTMLLLPSAIEMQKANIQLVTLDTHSEGTFVDLYRLFATKETLSRSMLDGNEDTVCFQDAVVGLSKYTTWYQYGFFEPQGPIAGHSVSDVELKQFANFVRTGLNIVVDKTCNGPVVLLTRKSTRLIVNELELTLSLAKELNKTVVLVGMETHSVQDMIAIISKASLLIGMHGSLFILSLFLPPEGVVIEMFPYAVNPDNYTPYKTLASIKGIQYRAWRNMDENKSLSYPDRQQELGGIAHLSLEEQVRIKNSHEVTPHLCCTDPNWLFRIFQDTIVDIPAIVSLIKSGVSDSAVKSENSQLSRASEQNMYPTHVRKVSCQPGALVSSIELSWEMPFNLAFIDFASVKYEVWVQEVGQEQYSAWMISKTQYTFGKHLKPNTLYSIWIRCILNDTVIGPFNTEQIQCVSSR